MTKTTKTTALSVLLVGFIVMFLSASVKNVYQVNFLAIGDSFGLNRAEFSLSATVFMLVTGVGAFFAGMLSDRIGPKWTIVTGSLLVGVTFLVCSMTTSFPVFVTMYGVGAALALAAIQYVPMGVLVDRHFSEKRKGLAYATLTNGTGIGFAVLSPLWVYLNQSVPWDTVFMWLGLLFAVVVTVLVILTLSNDPPPAPALAEEAPSNWSAVFTDSRFWFLSLSFFGCGLNMAFIDVHFVPLMQDDHVSPAIIGGTLTVLGVAEMAGGFVAGILAGRGSPALLLSGFYMLRGLSSLVLASSSSGTMLFVFSILFGATYLGTVILTSLFCLRIFGKRIKGAVFGVAFFIHQIGAVLATSGGAMLHGMLGNYDLVVLLAAAFSFASAILALPLLRAERPAQATTEAAS